MIAVESPKLIDPANEACPSPLTFKDFPEASEKAPPLDVCKMPPSTLTFPLAVSVPVTDPAPTLTVPGAAISIPDNPVLNDAPFVVVPMLSVSDASEPNPTVTSVLPPESETEPVPSTLNVPGSASFAAPMPKAPFPCAVKEALKE